jgi:enoyl-CoA hydratase/carnithine racemase
METIRYELAGAVAVITLNRPERKNGLTAEMLERLFATLARADEDVCVRSILVRGSEGTFSAGGDIAVEMQGGAANRKLPPFGRMAVSVIRSRKPVVAAIDTYCIGGALAVALLCDVRFASPATTFSTAFTRIGLAAELGMAWTLPRVVGTGAALDLLLSSRTFETEEAARLGLINFVSSADRLHGDALAYARNLAQRSPQSMLTIKRQVLAAYDETLECAFERSDALMAAAADGPDWEEGHKAFLAKRPAQFASLPADSAGNDLGE